jgi:hypothetical protein
MGNSAKKKPLPNAGVTTSKIKFCDLSCNDAGFAKVDALDGSCRTFQSLWCDQLEKHVTKNAPCEAEFGKRRPTTGF